MDNFRRIWWCRNCMKHGVRHEGGLCYGCWHVIEYGREAEPDEFRGDGAAKNIPGPEPR